MSYDHILLPVDGSDRSTAAVERGLNLARAFGATVHALSVIDTRSQWGLGERTITESLRAAAERTARAATAEVAERAADEVTVVREFRDGHPHEVILDYCSSAGIDLVSMGTHARSEPDAPLGSTADRVVRLADVPVLTSRTSGAPIPSDVNLFDELLVATDGSVPATNAASHAITIAERYGATVHVLYVVDEGVYEFGDDSLGEAPRSRDIQGLLERAGQEAVDELVASAEAVSVPADGAVLTGRPAERIRAYADGTDADLVVMGARGHSGLVDALLGSTTARTLGHGPVPVLTSR